MMEPQKTEEGGAAELPDALLLKAQALNAKYAANDPVLPGTTTEQQPDGKAEQQTEEKPNIPPDSVFDATADLVVVGIKKGLERFEGGEAAAAVWDDPMFRMTLLPVLKKYNLSIYSIPPELALAGAILVLAFKSADAIKEAKNAKEKTPADQA